MTTKISNIIAEIESKISSLKEKYNVELDKNKQLTSEVEGLKQTIEELNKTQETLKFELNSSQEELNVLKQNNSKSGSKDENKDLEIDFLVSEIDQCISQIKNNL